MCSQTWTAEPRVTFSKELDEIWKGGDASVTYNDDVNMFKQDAVTVCLTCVWTHTSDFMRLSMWTHSSYIHKKQQLWFSNKQLFFFFTAMYKYLRSPGQADLRLTRAWVCLCLVTGTMCFYLFCFVCVSAERCRNTGGRPSVCRTLILINANTTDWIPSADHFLLNYAQKKKKGQ